MNLRKNSFPQQQSMQNIPAPKASNAAPSPKVYTLEEASSLLKVHTITVRRLIKRRLLRRMASIRDIRIPAEDLDRLIHNQALDMPKRRFKNDRSHRKSVE